MAFVLPLDNNALVREYGTFVKQLIAKFNKAPGKGEDIVQDTWLKLFAADVLGKFRAKQEEVVPLAMTGADAAAYCDMSFTNFRVMVRAAIRGIVRKGIGIEKRSNGAPVPILEGCCSDPKTLYMTEDVIHFRNKAKYRVRLHPSEPLPSFEKVSYTRHHFEAYLTQCVHNNFSNFCRTVSRRDKDAYLEPNEDGSAWESNIPYYGEDPFECASLNLVLNHMGESGRQVLEKLEGKKMTLEMACKQLGISLKAVRGAFNQA